ncbi:MAG: virulence-associated E family protein [Synechococcaceae cyanobacterium]|nr:virulence-associated E family protein [Synechococcaceae cyanobacterium]
MADLQLIQSGLPTGGGTIAKPESLHPGRLSSELLQNLGHRLRFNELTLKPELDSKPMPDHMLQHFYVTLGQVGWKIDKGGARDALLYAARFNSYHPIKEYLHHLEVNGDVQSADLSSLATTYLGTADPLYDAMLAATLIGAVARVVRPGCKFDTCTVLRGAQGIFKSTFWNALASPSWFCDTPNDDKDLKLAIQTCWIYELAELETKTNRQEAGAIKALLSSSVDSFRVPYGGGIEDHPRPSILVGSCNRSDFLRDETGSRRFWVIDLPHDPDRGQQIDIAKVREHRDQIWKAAVLAYRAQQLPILSPKQQLESNRRNRGFEPEHIWLAPLQRWLDSGSASSCFTTDEALVGAGLRENGKLSPLDARCAAGVLRDLGCQQDQHQTRIDGGKRFRLWRRASAASDSALPSETGQTDCSAVDQRDLSRISDEFLELPLATMAGKSVGKLSESSETARAESGVGSGADAFLEDDDPAWGPRPEVA